MAFGGFNDNQHQAPMADINVTPMVDVMLVLLVIFIISAPLMASSLQLDLPRTAGAVPNPALQSISLAVDSQGTMYFGDTAVTAPELAERVRAAARANPAVEVQLRADQRVPYGRVAELIGLVQEAGLSRIGFVTEAAGSGAAGALPGGAPGGAPR